MSQHVVFDETNFSAAKKLSKETTSYCFLDSFDSPSSMFRAILKNLISVQAPTSSVLPVPLASPAITVPPLSLVQSSAIPSPAPPQNCVIPPPTRMTTRGHLGIVKPKQIYTLLSSLVSRLPSSHQKAFSDPNWNPAMTKEYDAQIKNKTWWLVPRPHVANIINSVVVLA